MASAKSSVLDGDLSRICTRDIIQLVCEQSSRGLVTLIGNSLNLGDEERKQELLRCMHQTKQQLLRLRLLLAVCSKFKVSVACMDVHGALQRHSFSLQDTADKLYFNHQELAASYMAPIYDVNSAYDVLATGAFQLPSFIGDVAPPRAPQDRERAVLTSCCNTSVLQALLTARLPPGLVVLGVIEGIAAVGCDGEYEAKVLLEPAPQTPFDVVVAALQSGSESRDDAADPAPSTPSTSQPRQPTPGAAGVSAAGGGVAAGALSEEEVILRLREQGFDGDNFGALQPRWRWRLTNVALKAGSGTGHVMNYSQLQYLRAELDFRMMHARHAAMVRHLQRLLGTLPEAPHERRAHPSASAASGAASQGADALALRPSGGTAEACLREAHVDLAAAALSAPLALMHSVLHDVASSMVFRAAADAVRGLRGRWEGQLRLRDKARLVEHGMRIEYWVDTPLVASPQCAAQRPDTPPALEIGTVDGRIAVRHDPPFEELWREGGDALAGAQPPAELRLDFVGVDVERVLFVAAASLALSQLAVLREALGQAMVAKGFPPGSLDADLRLVQSRSAAAFVHGSQDAVNAAAAPQERADGVTGMDVDVKAEEDETSGVAWWDPEQLEAALGGGGGAHGDAHFAVPALLVLVRQQVMFCVTMDLHSGALVLHNGDFSVPGAALRQALSLADEQKWLRQRQTSARGVVADAQPLSAKLLDALADRLAAAFLTGVLRYRAYHRLSLAASLELQRAPVRTRLLEDLCRRNPDARYFLSFRGAPAFLAMPPMPASSSLLNLPLRAGIVPPQLNTARMDLRSRCRLQLHIVIGCELVPDTQKRTAGLEGDQDRAAITGVLLTSVLDFRGVPVMALRARPVPVTLFEAALECAGRGDAHQLLQDLAPTAHARARGWWNDPDTSRRSAACPFEAAGDAGARAHGNPSVHAASSAVASAWGGAASSAEAAEVALLTRWCEDRAIGEYLDAELRAMGVRFDVSEVPLPDEPHAPPGRMQTSFAVRAARSMNAQFPEAAVPWPGCLGAPDAAAMESDSALSAAIRSVSIVATSAVTYEVRVASTVHAVMLRLLEARGRAAPTQRGALNKWRLLPSADGQVDVLVRRYSLQRNHCTAMDCVKHLMELVLTRNYLVALEALAPVTPGSVEEEYTLRRLQRAAKRACVAPASAADGAAAPLAVKPEATLDALSVPPVGGVPPPMPSPMFSPSGLTPMSPETPAQPQATPAQPDAAQAAAGDASQRALTAAEIVPGSGMRTFDISGARIQVCLSNIDEITISVFQPHPPRPHGQQGAEGSNGFAQPPCQRFVLRSGAQLGWGASAHVPESREMWFSMACELEAEAPIHQGVYDHLLKDIRLGHMHRFLTAIAIVSHPNTIMLDAVKPSSLAHLRLHPSLTVEVQCLMPPFRYLLAIENTASAKEAPPANGAAAPHMLPCCQISLMQTQTAWLDLSPAHFDQYWELRRRQSARSAPQPRPVAFPEVHALVKGLVDAFPGSVAPAASYLSANFEPVPADNALSVEVQHRVLAAVLQHIVHHVARHISSPVGQTVI